MKNYFYLIIFSFVIYACGGTTVADNDLDGLKAQLKSKSEIVKKLQDEIIEIQTKINELEPPREKEAVLVSTKVLEPKVFNRYTTVQGSVQSEDVVFASSETGGRITSLRVKEGDRVRKGQLLATVDLQTLNTQKAELETQLSLAQDVFARQKRLWDQNIGSEVQYLQAKNSVERIEKGIETLNTQLAKANIYAPISGVVDRELLQSGEMAAPGAPILQLLSPNQLKVVADVSESYLGKVNVGDHVEIFFPALGETIERKVSMIGRTIDPSNRTFKVEVNTGNPENKYKPNLLAELIFNDYSEKDALTVPANVVLEEVSGKKYLFTTNEVDGKLVAKKSYLTIGESYNNEVVVTSGLEAGAEIIIDGARSVSNGDPIIKVKS